MATTEHVISFFLVVLIALSTVIFILRILKLGWIVSILIAAIVSDVFAKIMIWDFANDPLIDNMLIRLYIAFAETAILGFGLYAVLCSQN